MTFASEHLYNKSMERGVVMVTEAKRRANAKSDAKNTARVQLKLSKNTDADILEHLNSLDNKQGYIKELIRADIQKKGME